MAFTSFILLALASAAAGQSDAMYTYVAVGDAATWADARAACRARGAGADLAVIPDRTHNLAALAAMRASNVMIAWLGIYDAANSDDHTWVNGATPAYSRWVNGDPRHGADNCATMYNDEAAAGRWDERSCDSDLIGSSAHVATGRFCANNQAVGDHLHGFGYSRQDCSAASANQDGCSGTHFYWAPSYNGQCKCATDDCTDRGVSGGHNVYQILTPGYVCGIPVPTANPTTAMPTQQPVMAPTQWFEHPGHEANVTVLQSAVAALEVTVRSLQTQLTASTGLPAQIEALTSRMTAMETGMVTVQEQAADSAALRAALIAAVRANDVVIPADCSGDSCAPVITATGRDVEIRATGGKVRFTTDGCGAVDLCEVGAFAVNLKAALTP